MKDIAIYVNTAKEAGTVKPYITVFSFSDEAATSVKAAIMTLGVKTFGHKDGNKPNSKKYQVYCTRDEFNAILETVTPAGMV